MARKTATSEYVTKIEDKVIAARDKTEMSFREIGDIFGISVGTARKIYYSQTNGSSISLQERYQILAAQGFKCAVCYQELHKYTIDYVYEDDNRAVRGIVCSDCERKINDLEELYRQFKDLDRPYRDSLVAYMNTEIAPKASEIGVEQANGATAPNGVPAPSTAVPDIARS